MAPQSSWILRPMQPPAIWSTSESGLAELPRPRKPKLIGHSSAACSILPTFQAPPQSMPTVIGPSEPPSMVVTPLEIACSQSCALSKWTCTSMPPGVAISPSASRTVVAAPQSSSGSTPSMTAGLPALPTPAIRPSLMPMSPLTIPSTGSMTTAFDTSMSSEPCALSRPATRPMPSRSVLPPPCRHSSPGTPWSCSISASSSLSPAARNRRWWARRAPRSPPCSSVPSLKPP